MDSTAYHLEELSIAGNPDDPRRSMPPISGGQRRILDVGCGAGQTLIASNLDSSIIATGVDVDYSALLLGKSLDERMRLVCAKGEALPFRSDYFDLLISRVAMPYMHIPRALEEFSRVLKVGGNLWIVLHPVSMTVRELQGSLSRLQLKAAIYRMFVIANGITLHLSGKQFPLPLKRDRYESCQTGRGITKSLSRAGFQNVRVDRRKGFIVTAEKAATREMLL